MASGPGAILYPNVSTNPQQVNRSQKQEKAPKQGQGQDFQKDFENFLTPSQDLGQQNALKISAHASQRMQERNIQIDSEAWSQIQGALDQAKAKGIQDTLVLTDDAALVVSVKNQTVVTAMDKASLSGNVFSNIDGAVIV